MDIFGIILTLKMAGDYIRSKESPSEIQSPVNFEESERRARELVEDLPGKYKLGYTYTKANQDLFEQATKKSLEAQYQGSTAVFGDGLDPKTAVQSGGTGARSGGTGARSGGTGARSGAVGAYYQSSQAAQTMERQALAEQKLSGIPGTGVPGIWETSGFSANTVDNWVSKMNSGSVARAGSVTDSEMLPMEISGSLENKKKDIENRIYNSNVFKANATVPQNAVVENFSGEEISSLTGLPLERDHSNMMENQKEKRFYDPLGTYSRTKIEDFTGVGYRYETSKKEVPTFFSPVAQNTTQITVPADYLTDRLQPSRTANDLRPTEQTIVGRPRALEMPRVMPKANTRPLGDPKLIYESRPTGAPNAGHDFRPQEHQSKVSSNSLRNQSDNLYTGPASYVIQQSTPMEILNTITQDPDLIPSYKFESTGLTTRVPRGVSRMA